MNDLRITALDVIAHTVLMSDTIPAHDQTFDLAAEIAQKLCEFHAYITGDMTRGSA